MVNGPNSGMNFEPGASSPADKFIGELTARQLAVLGGLPELGGGGPPEDQNSPIGELAVDVPKFGYNKDLATPFE